MERGGGRGRAYVPVEGSGSFPIGACAQSAPDARGGKYAMKSGMGGDYASCATCAMYARCASCVRGAEEDELGEKDVTSARMCVEAEVDESQRSN